MKDKLQIEVRSVYGCVKFYPLNETAKIFADIAGTVTLADPVLRQAERLGYLVETVSKSWTSKPLAKTLSSD